MNSQSLCCQRTALRGSALLARPPARAARPRLLAIAPRAGTFSDVATYLSEAARQIFTPTRTSTAPWERTAQPFSGSITHHEEVPRLRALLAEISTAKADLESRLDGPLPGVPDALDEPEEGLGEYVTTSIEKLMAANFTGDATEPVWSGGGYRESWKTQRDVRRAYDRLSRFERVVKKTLETAEAKK